MFIYGLNKRAKYAFTLIELLVVISIISILISILLPALGKARMAARSIQCASNLHGIAVAMEAYKSDMKAFYPAAYHYNDGILAYQRRSWGAALWRAGYIQAGVFTVPDNDLQGSNGADGNVFHCPQIKQNISTPASMALTMGHWSNGVPVSIASVIASYSMNVTTAQRIRESNAMGNDNAVVDGANEIWTHARDYLVPSNEALIMEASNFSVVGQSWRAWGGGWIPHTGSANILYHDGHATLMREEDIPDPGLWRNYDDSFWSQTLWTQHP